MPQTEGSIFKPKVACSRLSVSGDERKRGRAREKQDGGPRRYMDRPFGPVQAGRVTLAGGSKKVWVDKQNFTGRATLKSAITSWAVTLKVSAGRNKKVNPGRRVTLPGVLTREKLAPLPG